MGYYYDIDLCDGPASYYYDVLSVYYYPQFGWCMCDYINGNDKYISTQAYEFVQHLRNVLQCEIDVISIDRPPYMIPKLSKIKNGEFLYIMKWLQEKYKFSCAANIKNENDDRNLAYTLQMTHFPDIKFKPIEFVEVCFALKDFKIPEAERHIESISDLI